MSISKALSADVKELNALINAAYRGDGSNKGWTTEAHILGGLRVDEAALEKSLQQEGLTVLKYTDENGAICGTVTLELKPSLVYLGMFAVWPGLQGKGIGGALLQAGVDFARAHHRSRIVMTVISSRSELIAWYQRQGYVATGHSIAFEEIEGRFGDPKVPEIRLIEMEKVIA